MALQNEIQTTKNRNTLNINTIYFNRALVLLQLGRALETNYFMKDFIVSNTELTKNGEKFLCFYDKVEIYHLKSPILTPRFIKLEYVIDLFLTVPDAYSNNISWWHCYIQECFLNLQNIERKGFGTLYIENDPMASHTALRLLRAFNKKSAPT